MEGLDETSKNLSSKMGFFKHVFNFDDDSKSEILNIIQYSVLAIIPIVILNKLSQKYVPEADEEKGSLEILAEVIIQVLVMFLGLLIVNRIIIYLPTYSGIKYPDFNIIYIVLAVLMITLSLQTKLGEKVSLLVDRVVELWDGKMGTGDDKDKKKKKKNGNVKVSQPIAGQSSGMILPQQTQDAAISQSLYSGGSGSTSISQLPNEQPTPNYDNMYQNNNTPMPGAATPGQEGFVPMAANEGGGAFGSPFGGGF